MLLQIIPYVEVLILKKLKTEAHTACEDMANLLYNSSLNVDLFRDHVCELAYRVN